MDCNTQIHCPVHIHYVITIGMCQVFYFDSSQLTKESAVFSEFGSDNFRGNSVALVRTRTIPTERPPPVGEVSAKFADRGVSRGQCNGSPQPLFSVF